MSARVTITTSDQLGQVLQGARKIAGLTQAEAATRLAISQSRVSHMELNPDTISVAQLLALLGAYELDLVIEPRAVRDKLLEKLDW
ncbi:helix-turn-helix domain-containing protein [Cupriavidus agavae]|uniref:HTH-type transcriptional regulator/antitoxin HipB n=1 Tax=Cupriavidus agavae TaxID=1001822 RepID=A0A4Q7RCF0_9BURK|nr:helix-turn-helix transcriptional regulator [Cupriavidus agavae]RZT30813.1 HTH-type transcriptional regulator/antitoxin HipB [Cupriavidus agavae]